MHIISYIFGKNITIPLYYLNADLFCRVFLNIMPCPLKNHCSMAAKMASRRARSFSRKAKSRSPQRRRAGCWDNAGNCFSIRPGKSLLPMISRAKICVGSREAASGERAPVGPHDFPGQFFLCPCRNQHVHKGVEVSDQKSADGTAHER